MKTPPRFIISASVTFAFVTSFGCGTSPRPEAHRACSGWHAGDVLLTEVMTDPDGTDVGAEWVELFNPTDRDLSLDGLTLAASDSSAREKTHVMHRDAGALTIRAGTFFVAGASRTGPLWQAYSYGTALGEFGQTAGRLALRCDNLVVDEMEWSTSSAPGHSRQYDVATNVWCEGRTVGGTPASANDACFGPLTQTCLDPDGGRERRVVTPAEGDLVITEVMAAPKVASDSVGEWFELFSRGDFDLNGVDVVTSTTQSTLESPTCLRVGRGQFAVVARSYDAFVNGGLPPPLARFTGSLSSNNERLKLVVGDAGIDAISLWKSTAGVSWQLDGQSPPRADDNDEPSRFCLAKSAWPHSGGDWGTPGAPNAPCAPRDAGAETDGGHDDAGAPDTCFDLKLGRLRALRPPAWGDLVITEVMADPTSVSDESGEWFEVRATHAVDLNGVGLGTDVATVRLASAQCWPVDPGALLLFARSGDPALNGALPPVDAVFSFSLANSGERVIRLIDARNVELGRWAYRATTAGVSTQLDATTGQTCKTPSEPSGVTHYNPSGDVGTPGRPNLPCPD